MGSHQRAFVNLPIRATSPTFAASRACPFSIVWLLHISRPEMQIAIMCKPSPALECRSSAPFITTDQPTTKSSAEQGTGCDNTWVHRWRGRRQCSFPAASLSCVHCAGGAGVFVPSLCLPHTSAMLSRSKLQPLGAAAHRRERFRWSWSGPDHSAAAYNTLADTLSRTTSPSSNQSTPNHPL